MNLILAIDQGTTGTTAALYDVSNLNSRALSKVEFPQYFPEPGWVEHDPDEIITSVRQAIREVLAKVPAATIQAIGISNQRETVVAWHRESGALAGRAIVWQDRRTAAFCEGLKQKDKTRAVLEEHTGLVCDPYFSASKIRWILEHQPLAAQWAKTGELAVGTIDSYLIYRLTDGKSFCTEHTNASRTMLYDLHKGEFTAELLAIFGIPKAILPEIRASNAHFGVTTNFLPLPDGVPITGCLGDQQAALFGHGFTETGGAKVTMGTGAFLLFNVGNTLQRSTSSKEMQGLLTTVALAPKGGDRSFAVEASAFIAGAAVQFLRDNFGWFEKSIECEALIAASKRDPNLLFIPALAGLGSPYWNADAKGVLFGLTRGSTRGEIVRAVVESIAFQNVYLLDLMQRCGGAALRDLAVDGKVALNDPLMQLQSDILGIPVLRPADVDITARGAARIALAGLTNDIGTATNITQTGTARKFIPAPDHARTKTLYDEWCRAQHVVDQFYRGKFW